MTAAVGLSHMNLLTAPLSPLWPPLRGAPSLYPPPHPKHPEARVCLLPDLHLSLFLSGFLSVIAKASGPCRARGVYDERLELCNNVNVSRYRPSPHFSPRQSMRFQFLSGCWSVFASLRFSITHAPLFFFFNTKKLFFAWMVFFLLSPPPSSVAGRSGGGLATFYQEGIKETSGE